MLEDNDFEFIIPEYLTEDIETIDTDISVISSDQTDNGVSVLTDTVEIIDYSEKLDTVINNLQVLNVLSVVIAATLFLFVTVRAIKKALCLDFL